MLYVLISNSKVYESTVSTDRRECWAKGFEVVAAKLGDEWRQRYWKLWLPSIRSARKHGFRVQKASLALRY